MSTLETNLVQPSTGTTLTLGASGDTVDVPSGATLDVTGATVTGLSAGKILQVVTATHSTAVTVTGTTFTSSGLAASITPASTSNKILILTTSAISTFGDGSSSSGRTGKITLRRGGATDTELTTMEIGINARTADTSTLPKPFNIVTFTFLDSPSTTSSQTYTVAIRGDGACDITAQGSDRTSSITLLEVSA